MYNSKIGSSGAGSSAVVAVQRARMRKIDVESESGECLVILDTLFLFGNKCLMDIEIEELVYI